MLIKDKILQIFLSSVPVIAMVALIPAIANDYALTAAYLLIIAAAFAVKYERKDGLFFAAGFIIMLFSEYFFISTGVETFARNSLFGVMPLWLPLLWAYAFVAMRRGIFILDK
ncbi:hypothetical protein HYX10_06195 [Candidatus Woesearchaeota archaeon]|nr:hypothetical protein [Candidatus Woesearchaeota archaeon]